MIQFMNDFVRESKSSRPSAPLAFGAVLFFLLELATYAVAAWWGLTAFEAWPLRLLAGFGAPALLVVAWARLGGPKATRRLKGAGRAALLAGWFGSAVAGLIALERPGLAAMFAVLAATVSAGDLATRR